MIESLVTRDTVYHSIKTINLSKKDRIVVLQIECIILWKNINHPKERQDRILFFFSFHQSYFVKLDKYIMIIM